MANDDSYESSEDVSLNTQSGPIIATDFDLGTVVNPAFDEDWDYLDRIENPLGADESYPLDGTGNEWNSVSFDVASSTIGPWGSGPLPLQGGIVEAFPGATPDLLLGIGDGPNGQNSITTYLFRNTLTLTAEEAALPVWIANLAVDDGCVIYINGVRVGSIYMPDTAITASTFGNTGNEAIYNDVALNVAGTLVTGVNTIAVEVHQGSYGSSDIGLDLSLRAGSGVVGGFVYEDDPFGTDQPEYASGAIEPDAGFAGAGLHVAIGGLDNRFVQAPHSTSGGFRQTFTIAGPTTLDISFRYRLTTTTALEQNESGEAVFELDGVRHGGDANDSLVHIDDGGDSGWQVANFSLPVAGGNHTFTLGAFSSGTSRANEMIDAYFDDVSVTRAGGGGGSVLENDTVGDNPRVTVVATTTHGILNMPSDGVFLYTPHPDFFGVDTFSYEVTDDTGTSAPATVTINVLPVNDAPIAAPLDYELQEDSVFAVSLPSEGVLGNDYDPDGDGMTTVLEEDVEHGTLELNSDGTFTYTPEENFFGTDTFSYRADDGSAQSDPADVTLTVAGVPDPPAAQDDQYSVLENTSLVVSVPGGAAGGVEEVVPYDAEWKYDDTGTDLLTAWREPNYDDGQWSMGFAELGYGDGDENEEVEFGGDPDDVNPTTYFRRTFSVSNVGSIESATCSVFRDDGIVVFLNGTRIGIDNFAPGADPEYGTYARSAGDDGNLEIELPPIDPSLFQEGVNTLAVEIHQSDGGSSDISFNLKLEVARTTINGVLENDTDLDGQPLTATLESAPANGTAIVNPDGTFVYTPGLNFEGQDSFTYRASNGLASSVGTVTIEVTPSLNDIPETQSDSYSLLEDVEYVRNAAQGVLSNDIDPDGDPMTVSLYANSLHGTLGLNDDGSFTYTPDLNYFGPDSFLYTVSDGKSVSPPQTVNLTVNNVPDAPIAIDDEYATDPGAWIWVDASSGLLLNDSDPDGTPMLVELGQDVQSGTLTLGGDGSLFYEPAHANAGLVTFTYRAFDGALHSQEATVTIHLDTAPAGVADSYSVVEDTPRLIPSGDGVLKNDTDAENHPLTAVLLTQPNQGQVVFRADGSFEYTPARDHFGSDTFTYAAVGGVRSSDPVTVTLNIGPVNDGPEAVDDSYLAILDQELSVTAAAGVLANDVDVDSESLIATLVSPPLHGGVVLNQDGSFTYTHTPGFSGADRFTYVAGDGFLDSLPATVTIQIGGASEAIVINEIMYHPMSELDGHEYIELVNIGDGPVRLQNWKFTSGVNFAFPDVFLAAGEFLVIAADPVEFTATYGPVTNLIGGWIGSLSNRGERVRLADEKGEQVDELTYSDQGDWALRTRVTDTGEPGWIWEAAHDGTGESLELIYARLTNKSGQNWGSSVGGPTPGAVNSIVQEEAAIAPLIHGVEHRPRVPTSTETVTIRAELRDTSMRGLSATLYYRVSALEEPEFSDTAMVDDGLHNDGEAGDGIYAASLPAMVEGSVIEFYVFATDGLNARTWPAPTSIGQVANAHYQVDNEPAPEGQGIYRLVLNRSESRAFSQVDRDSNAQHHCTLIADDCSGPVVRYLCGMRVRGASSRRDNPPPMRVNIPRDTPWNETTQMNLNSQFTWLQFMGMKILQASDLAASDSKRIALRRNGNDPTSGNQEDYGSFVHLQPPNGEFIDDKIPEDRQGNLYKKVRPDVDWAYRDGDLTRYARDGWGKQTNDSEDDWSDLDEFLRVMNEAPGSPDYIDQVEVVANLDQWMRWFAAEALIANGETNASNGADDDYSMYRGVVDPRFIFLPHDLDTILGQGDGSRITDPEFTIFDMSGRGDSLGPLVPLFNEPEIRTRYFMALRDLLQSSFSKPRFDALVRNNLTGWVPNGRINDVIDFMDARRTHVTGLVEAELGPPGALLAPANLASQTEPHGTVYLSEILAVNESAHEHAGSFPDYIEIRNGGAALSLAGYSITDDPAIPDKFVFPAGLSIAAGQRLLIYADSETSPGIHLGFSLNGAGEHVVLYDSAGNVLDAISFGPQVADRSIGRTGAGEMSWNLNQPTPGSSNQPHSLGDPVGLRINEWLTKPEVVYSQDFLEIYNPDPLPVSLGGMAVTDDPLNYPTRAILPALSFVAGGGFAVLEAVGAGSANRPGELPFKLASDHGWLAIYGSNGVEIDRVHTLCDARDQSQGRETDGAALYAQFAVPTPGFSNTADLSAQSAILQSLRITEIMYHPPAGSDAEFIEVRNVGTAAINLEGVEFTKGVEFKFPNISLAPGEYAVVVANLVVFQNIYGFGVNVLGEWKGKLDNDADRVRLEIVDLNAAILDFTFQDVWYPTTDGGGFSLVIVDEQAGPQTWDEKGSWTAGASSGGSPGMSSGFFVFAGADQIVTLPAGATLDATVHYGPLDPGTVSLIWSLDNGPAVANFGNETNEDTTVTVPSAGRYTFELIATPQIGPLRSGKVTVVFQDSYPAWAARHFADPSAPEAQKLADGDLDGYSNLIEFAIGFDPSLPNSGVMLDPVMSETGHLSMTYFRRYLSDAAVVTPEVSSDLATWQVGPVNLIETVVSSNGEGEFIRVEDRFDYDGVTPRFLRLRVDCSE